MEKEKDKERECMGREKKGLMVGRIRHPDSPSGFTPKDTF